MSYEDVGVFDEEIESLRSEDKWWRHPVESSSARTRVRAQVLDMSTEAVKVCCGCSSRVGVVAATIDGGKIQRIKVCIFVAFSEKEVEERYVKQGRRNPGDERSLNAGSGDTSECPGRILQETNAATSCTRAMQAGRVTDDG